MLHCAAFGCRLPQRGGVHGEPSSPSSLCSLMRAAVIASRQLGLLPPKLRMTPAANADVSLDPSAECAAEPRSVNQKSSALLPAQPEENSWICSTVVPRVRRILDSSERPSRPSAERAALGGPLEGRRRGCTCRLYYMHVAKITTWGCTITAARRSSRSTQASKRSRAHLALLGSLPW